MAKNWKDLKPNDKLYLLVPIVDEYNVPCYEFQESYVINHKVTEYGVTIRFKHNDSNGKRQRKELTVANDESIPVFSYVVDNRIEKKPGFFDKVRSIFKK